MKKIIMFLILLLYGISLAVFINQDNMAVLITLSLFVTLFSAYFYFEKAEKGTKEIALIATLSAFAAISRVPFAAIPNVQPVTFLVALSGLVFGIYPGFLIGSTTAFISNIFLGQGPWTPWQMFAWGIVGAISGIIGKRKKPSLIKFGIICFGYGFLFDWIMNLWHVLGFIKPLTIKSIALVYLSSFTFDVMHSIGNFIFCVIFYDKFYNVLKRFKNRIEITYK